MALAKVHVNLRINQVTNHCSDSEFFITGSQCLKHIKLHFDKQLVCKCSCSLTLDSLHTGMGPFHLNWFIFLTNAPVKLEYNVC